MLYLTRKEHFNAAHKLWNAHWSPEKNFEVFGKCANPNWHGHNFDIHVTIKGTPDPDTGMLINLTELKKIIKDEVIERIDHKNLNLDVDFMEGKLTSIENLAIGIWNILFPILDRPNFKLYSIKLYETERNFVEYRGE